MSNDERTKIAEVYIPHATRCFIISYQSLSNTLQSSNVSFLSLFSCRQGEGESVKRDKETFSFGYITKRSKASLR